MKDNKNLTAADILQTFGIVLLGFGMFFGAMFTYSGELTFTIPTVLVILIALFGFSYVAIKLKKADTDQQTMMIWEIVVLILGYGAACIASLFFFIHFVNIEFNLKKEVQQAATNKIENLRTLFVDYESFVEDRALEYEVKIGSAIKSKNKQRLKEYNIDIGNKPGVQKTERVKSMKEKLNLEYTGLKEDAMGFISQSSGIIENWNRLSIPATFFNIQGMEKIWKEDLVKMAKSHKETRNYEPDCESASKIYAFFCPNQQINAVELSNPKAYFGSTNWLLTLLPFIILHALILWPYFFAERELKAYIDGKSGRKTGYDM